MRHGGRGHEIHPPDLGGIHRELACQLVHHPLEEEGGLGVSRAAVGTRRGAVGEDTHHLSRDVRDVVRARDSVPRVDRGHARPHADRIGTDVGEEPRAEAGDAAVAPGRDLGVLDLVAPVRGGEEAFAAPLRPGAGAARAHRQKGADHVLGVKAELGPEPSADVGGDEPQLVERQAKACAEGPRVGVGELARRVVDQPARRGVELGQHDAALERRGGDPVVGQTPSNDDLGLGKGALDVAPLAAELVADVVGQGVVKLGSTRLDGRLLFGDRGEHLVGDRDCRQRVLRRVGALGRDCRDRLADVPGTVAGQDRMQRDRDHAGGLPIAGEIADARQVVGRKDGHDARHRARRGGADREDPGVGVGRAQYLDAQGVGRRDQV